MDDIPIIPLTRLDLRYEPGAWPFAVARRAEIDAHFVKLRVEKPEMWNGRVLMMRRGDIADGVLTGAYLETDFASFIAWRDWGFPDTTMCNCFAMAALRAADGAFLLGQMGPHTATAGQIYFAAGTPDPADIVGDTVDLERGVIRELTEETGLTLADVTPQPGWTATPFGQRIALMKIVQAREDADCAARAHPRASSRASRRRSCRTCISCARPTISIRACRPMCGLISRRCLPTRSARREVAR